VPLVGPPERVLAHDLVLLEEGAHAPALVVGERVAVLLEERVDARDAAVLQSNGGGQSERRLATRNT